jgi:hypothetical protein
MQNVKPDTITVGELRDHLKLFDNDYKLYFGNGNLHFYRTKVRGDKLVQIEFNELTDLYSPQEWIPVERERPASPDTVAIVCRDIRNGIHRLTGFYQDGKWGVIGQKSEWKLAEITHWYALSDTIPAFRVGDPIG